jgi:hypothetical protein
METEVSVSSSNTKSSSMKGRKVAELELAQGKCRLELERQQEEINRRLQIQALEDKLARAEIEDGSNSEFSQDCEMKDEIVLPHDVPSANQKVQNYITQLNEHNVPCAPGSDGMNNIMCTIQERLNLPKAELLTFSGNPLDYCKFIRNFETNIESRVQDFRLRLSYLIQYCSGDAKCSVEDCVVLPPKEWYVRAKQILLSRYGKPHLVVRSHVERLINGNQIKANDVQGLMNLSLDMEKCQITLSHLGYSSNSENLRKIVRRLPMHA